VNLISFDITDALTTDEKQAITVSVWDPTNQTRQPNGKPESRVQIERPHY
jgi:hypothetical protein